MTALLGCRSASTARSTWVADRLRSRTCEVGSSSVTTTGDRDQTTPLARLSHTRVTLTAGAAVALADGRR